MLPTIHSKQFKRILFSLLLVALFSLNLSGQIPAGYYDDASGLSGDALKSALNNIISGHNTYPYTSTATDVWDILKDADQDPNNASNVIGIYSGFSMNAALEYDGGAGWNREHVWAKSRGDFGTTQGAGTDCHHIVAADVSPLPHVSSRVVFLQTDRTLFFLRKNRNPQQSLLNLDSTFKRFITVCQKPITEPQTFVYLRKMK